MEHQSLSRLVCDPRHARGVMRRILVYGTLLAGEPNHHVLGGSRLVDAGRTLPRYRLVDLGSFPGLVTKGITSVTGEVYAVDTVVQGALDRLEGHPTFFKRSAVRLDDGRRVETYILLASSAGCPSIPSGDWRAWRQGKATR